MNVDITEEEYLKLLNLLAIADFVLTGHKTETDPAVGPYETLIQKFYSRAAEAQLAEKVSYDSDLGKYLPDKTLDRSEDARRLLDEFVDESFWHELIFRFTERDVERQVGGHANLHRLSPEERFDHETPVEEHYVEEFSEHGIDRLEIIENFGVDGGGPKTSD